jgi:aldose 1-epimerase
MIANEKCGCRKASFGFLPDGRNADLFTLTNTNGMSVTLTTFGAAVVSISVPDKNGKMGDVALGFDTIEGYLQETNPFFGSTIGRFANRIARGTFSLNGKQYTLAINNGLNHLHGGPKGFDKVLWRVEGIMDEDKPEITMLYTSPEGEEGYPGTMNVSVNFSLSDDNELKFDYRATSDADTVVNLTNHTYFNLSGSEDILGHILFLNAGNFTPIDETQIPTGEIQSVEGTPFDFTRPAAIGSRINQEEDQQIVNGLGYDHNFVCDTDGSLSRVAAVFAPETGRLREVLTTDPGVQFYSGNFLDGTLTGKKGVVYNKRSGFCLETQHFPDSPNRPEFPSVLLKEGEEFSSSTIYRFSVSDEIE